MENAPSSPVEHEGDVVSRADIDSLEGSSIESGTEMGESDYSFGVTYETTRAAARIVENPAQELPSAASLAYDAASEFVDKRSDQGLTTAAWEEADPTGKIREDYAREERQKQDGLNRRNIDQIQQSIHEARIAQIEALPTSEREAEMHQYLAMKRANSVRRGMRS